MNRTWSRNARYLTLFFIAVVGALVLYAVRDLFGPLFIAAFLAYVFNPIVSFVNERSRLPRKIVVSLLYVVALALLILLVLTLTPLLAEQIQRLSEEIQVIVENIEEQLSRRIFFLGIELQPGDWLSETGSLSVQFIRSERLVMMLQAATTNLVWVLVILVTTFYLLQDWSELRDWLFSLSPPWAESDMRRLYDDVKVVWQSYLRGQIVLMVLMGFLTWLSLTAIGLPGAAALALFTGLLNIIPTLGPALVMIIAALVAFSTGSTYLPLSPVLFALLVGAVYVLIQVLENVWLRPQIMASRLQIHPVIVFIGVIAALSLLGVLGVLVVVPLLGTITIVGNYLRCRILEINPWPDVDSVTESTGENVMKLNEEQRAMLEGAQGPGRQMAMRLLLDMAAAAGAEELVPISTAHLSGVSPLTGGLGLRRFLKRLAQDPRARVAVPTTLNAAGCDVNQFSAMHITAPDFLEHSKEIVAHYETLGVTPTQSCIPYEWDNVVTSGTAAWAESNAICFGNSYCELVTNRESGLSALAAALTGYTPHYGLLRAETRRPNVEVHVTGNLVDPTDFSILGDWIGKQVPSEWSLPYGPIPLLRGLAAELSHEQKKALTAAAANYGCPLLYIEGHGPVPEPAFEGTLTFDATALQTRYDELYPRMPASLVTIGCPQASVGELRATAELLRTREVRRDPAPSGTPPPLWIFTSRANKEIAERTGLADVIRRSGALLLENTCPEVVPYDQSWVRHVLTNSMKAEHYIKSGLNGIPTSVMTLADCVAVAAGEMILEGPEPIVTGDVPAVATATPSTRASKPPATGPFESRGRGLPSQEDYEVEGEAFVTDTPITLLGFVNRETGVIEEAGHPANGQSMAGKIAIFPKGSGSTVAPYVLLELYYRNRGPLAIINTDIDQQSAPACSLENIPYAYAFDGDILGRINNGDRVVLRRVGNEVTIQVLARATRTVEDPN